MGFETPDKKDWQGIITFLVIGVALLAALSQWGGR